MPLVAFRYWSAAYCPKKWLLRSVHRTGGTLRSATSTAPTAIARTRISSSLTLRHETSELSQEPRLSVGVRRSVRVKTEQRRFVFAL
jgi:hypothetical protein